MWKEYNLFATEVKSYLISVFNSPVFWWLLAQLNNIKKLMVDFIDNNKECFFQIDYVNVQC